MSANSASHPGQLLGRDLRRQHRGRDLDGASHRATSGARHRRCPRRRCVVPVTGSLTVTLPPLSEMDALDRLGVELPARLLDGGGEGRVVDGHDRRLGTAPGDVVPHVGRCQREADQAVDGRVDVDRDAEVGRSGLDLPGAGGQHQGGRRLRTRAAGEGRARLVGALAADGDPGDGRAARHAVAEPGRGRDVDARGGRAGRPPSTRGHRPRLGGGRLLPVDLVVQACRGSCDAPVASSEVDQGRARRCRAGRSTGPPRRRSHGPRPGGCRWCGTRGASARRRAARRRSWARGGAARGRAGRAAAGRGWRTTRTAGAGRPPARWRRTRRPRARRRASGPRSRRTPARAAARARPRSGCRPSSRGRGPRRTW